MASVRLFINLSHPSSALNEIDVQGILTVARLARARRIVFGVRDCRSSKFESAVTRSEAHRTRAHKNARVIQPDEHREISPPRQRKVGHPPAFSVLEGPWAEQAEMPKAATHAAWDVEHGYRVAGDDY